MPVQGFKRAVRENTNVLISLAGVSGSGKTMSSCELATGICGDEPFAVIDTEARRALHYATDYEFEHVEFGPPFTPRRYLDNVLALANRGFRCIVIDSGSHEHEGEGGLLDMAAASSKQPPLNWAPVKLEHKKFMRGLMQCPASIIMCLRAHDKIEMVPDPNRSGKQKVIHLGWSPICEKSVPYDMTISLTLRPETPGVIDLSLPHKLSDRFRMEFPAGTHIERKTGEFLGRWVRGEDTKRPDTELWKNARNAANEGKLELAALAGSLTEEQKSSLRPISRELNDTARKADALRDEQPF